MSVDRLVEALSRLPGLTATVFEVEGDGWQVWLWPDRDGDEVEDVVLLPTAEAWLSLMFVAWGVRAVPDVDLVLSMSPPMLNPVPDGWVLEGAADPGEVAGWVDGWNLIGLEGSQVDDDG